VLNRTYRGMLWTVLEILKPIKFVAKLIYRGLAAILKFIFELITSAVFAIGKLIKGIFTIIRLVISGIFH